MRAVQRNLSPWIMHEKRLGAVETLLRIMVCVNAQKQLTLMCRTLHNGVIIDTQVRQSMLDRPFVKGCASFNIVPDLAVLLTQIDIEPDIILCDGCGMITANTFGLASHVGLITHKPTLGVRMDTQQDAVIALPQRGDYRWLRAHDKPAAHAVLYNLFGTRPYVRLTAAYGCHLPSVVRIMTSLHHWFEPESFNLVLYPESTEQPIPQPDSA